MNHEMPHGLPPVWDDPIGVLVSPFGTLEAAHSRIEGRSVGYLAITEGTGEDSHHAGFEVRNRRELDQLQGMVEALRQHLPE